MKRAVLIISVIVLSSLITAAQNSKQKGVAASAAGKSSSRVLLGSGTQIEGQLQGSVDAKSSRVGDQVVVKTTKAIKQNGETVVPKGSRLIGRITEVQQKTRPSGGSRLGMVFERLEGKDLSTPISASIVSITNAAANGRVSDTAEADVFGSSATSTSTSRSTGSSGGGMLGGVGRTVGEVTNSAGGVLNTTTQRVGSVTNTAGQAVGSTAGTVGRTVNGIQISNSASGSAGVGTTLSSPNQNVRLEKGVTMQLQLNSSVRAQ